MRKLLIRWPHFPSNWHRFFRNIMTISPWMGNYSNGWTMSTKRKIHWTWRRNKNVCWTRLIKDLSAPERTLAKRTKLASAKSTRSFLHLASLSATMCWMRIMPSNFSLTRKKIWQDCLNGSAKVRPKKRKQPDNRENGCSPCTMPAVCLSCNILKIARSGSKYTKLISTAATTTTGTITRKTSARSFLSAWKKRTY